MVRNIVIYMGSILVSLAAGAIGSLATVPNIPTWYDQLAKPPLLPPNEVFGPTWTVLYVLMGVALALLITHRSAHDKKKSGYAWFGAQLVLNTLWSVVFFGMHLPWLAAVIILMLIGSIVMAMLSFRRLVPATSWLFAPYLVWVCFATYLNLGVAILN